MEQGSDKAQCGGGILCADVDGLALDPACPIPEIARLGRTLRKWKDAFLAYFDTGGASNGSTEAINGHYRAGQTHRQRLPQPHQLPTPNAPHRRKSRRLHPQLNSEEPLNAPFGARCFLTALDTLHEVKTQTS